MQIHPQLIEKNGKKEFVVLAYEEFLKIMEKLQDYEDLHVLREAKEEEKDAPTISLEDAKRKLGLGDR